MKNKENIIVYPFDSHFSPILRNKDFIDKYNKIYLSSLPGWGLCGKDAGYADGGCDLNIQVENIFEEYFDFCDTVIIVNSDNYCQCEKNIYPKIYSAIDAGKNIVSLMELSERTHEIEEYCKKKSVYFENCITNGLENQELFHNLKKENGILEINTPIISVIGLSENTHKFNVQLELKIHMQNMGYKVSLVGSREYCKFMGAHSFPCFMSNDNISEVDKIYLFNRYIKNIELTEKPDVIIIGVPGGVVPYNNKICNNFGITAYEVFQSVVPDASIVCIFHELYTPEYFEMISNTIKYRFGFDVDAFNISNRQIDWVEMTNSKPNNVRYVTLNSIFMEKRMLECRSITNIPLYNVLNTEDSFNIAKMLIDKLAECESAVTF